MTKQEVKHSSITDRPESDFTDALLTAGKLILERIPELGVPGAIVVFDEKEREKEPTGVLDGDNANQIRNPEEHS